MLRSLCATKYESGTSSKNSWKKNGKMFSIYLWFDGKTNSLEFVEMHYPFSLGTISGQFFQELHPLSQKSKSKSILSFRGGFLNGPYNTYALSR
jgi:hypothetical protein